MPSKQWYARYDSEFARMIVIVLKYSTSGIIAWRGIDVGSGIIMEE